MGSRGSSSRCRSRTLRITSEGRRRSRVRSSIPESELPSGFPIPTTLGDLDRHVLADLRGDGPRCSTRSSTRGSRPPRPTRPTRSPGSGSRLTCSVTIPFPNVGRRQGLRQDAQSRGPAKRVHARYRSQMTTLSAGITQFAEQAQSLMTAGARSRPRSRPSGAEPAFGVARGARSRSRAGVVTQLQRRRPLGPTAWPCRRSGISRGGSTSATSSIARATSGSC